MKLFARIRVTRPTSASIVFQFHSNFMGWHGKRVWLREHCTRTYAKLRSRGTRAFAFELLIERSRCPLCVPYGAHIQLHMFGSAARNARARVAHVLRAHRMPKMLEGPSVRSCGSRYPARVLLLSRRSVMGGCFEECVGIVIGYDVLYIFNMMWG